MIDGVNVGKFGWWTMARALNVAYVLEVLHLVVRRYPFLVAGNEFKIRTKFTPAQHADSPASEQCRHCTAIVAHSCHYTSLRQQ